MQRACFVLRVRPERLEQYREQHKHVWPEMLKAIRDCGWRNYSLFLAQGGIVIGYFEAANVKASVDALEQEKVNVLWQAEMAPYFADPGGGLRLTQEVFHTD